MKFQNVVQKETHSDQNYLKMNYTHGYKYKMYILNILYKLIFRFTY